MTITSYAQNFEDVILWRALKHVERGFYIDVGAQDPVIDSVSLAFYERGWRGVHVEPTPRYAEELRRARPDEEVIEAAITSAGREITFFELPETGLSTGDEAIARLHEAKGYSVQQITVPALPLSEVLESYRTRDIHWLKIDVEGMEEQVIGSWHPSPLRPWIVLVESTKPTSPEVSFAAWETQLIDLGYEFIYFDGLNRYYVSVDRPELKASFGPGPNVFDDFRLSGLASAPFCVRINAEKTQLVEEAAQALSGARAEAAQALSAARAEAAQALSAARAEAAQALSAARAEAAQALSAARAEAAQALSGARAEADFARAERNAARRALLDATKAWEIAKAGLMSDLVRRDKALSSRETEIARRNQELAALYSSTSWRVTAPLRWARLSLGWFMRGTLAWITFKPNSRPHRIATVMKLVSDRAPRPGSPPQPSNVTGTASQLQKLQPPMEGQTPSSSSLNASTLMNPAPVILDQLDTTSEPESVRRVYRQLTQARKQILRCR